MKNYDVIVIGSGAGLTIVEEALAAGLKTALIDRGPLGGTCLNLGCVPSKMLLFPADRIAEIQDSQKLGIEVEIKRVDFESIMERMRRTIQTEQEKIRRSVKNAKNLDYYETEARFTADYTLEAGGETIRGEKIFLAAGSRPQIPPVPGVEDVDYLTSDTVLQLTRKPASLLIAGGGYAGVEYAHFFAAMGTRVILVEAGDRLVRNEEPEISELLQKKLSRRIEIQLNTRIMEIKKSENRYSAITRNQDGQAEQEISAEAVMLATGRRSNADGLGLEKTGVDVNRQGFVMVDDYLETSKKNIYALGDIIGKYMFTHVSNMEAVTVWHNAMHDEPVEMDYRAVPHAVFTYPQIASAGLTEAEARKGHEVLVGKAAYFDTARGRAMSEEDGFAKAVADAETGQLLGFHIIGPEASTLIQEATNAMAAGGDIGLIFEGMHIHPAMPELVMRALTNLTKPQTVEIRPQGLKAAIPL